MKNNSLYNYSISLSGFGDYEKSEIIEKIQIIGAKYEENLKKSTTYLISNKINTEKCIVYF